MSNSMLYSNEHHKNEKTEVEVPLYLNYFPSRGKCETEDKTGHCIRFIFPDETYYIKGYN